MNIEEFRDYCISLNGVEETFPFDDKTLVFKVGGKMFALLDIDNFTFANLKCDPVKSIELREQFKGIKPGYHMSKKHWNSVYRDSDVTDNLFKELIFHSYDLVFQSLTKKIKEEITTL